MERNVSPSGFLSTWLLRGNGVCCFQISRDLSEVQRVGSYLVFKKTLLGNPLTSEIIEI